MSIFLELLNSEKRSDINKISHNTQWPPVWFYVAGALTTLCLVGICTDALASRLPGTDESTRLEAAGTLLRLIDTGLFKWGARVLAGLCIMSSAWSLKEQRFGVAIICIVGAIIFGTAPVWVKNIFDIGNNEGIFSLITPQIETIKGLFYA